MILVRHRRRIRPVRMVAVITPLCTAALLWTAALVGGRWWWAAVAVGTLSSALLGALLLRVERLGRVGVASARAAQAGAFATALEHYSAEQRGFAAHLLGLLEAAEDQVAVLLVRLEHLEKEVAATRTAAAEPLVGHDLAAERTPGPAASQALVRLNDGAEWHDLWPDLSDTPTVVDLAAWEERVRARLLPEPEAEPVECSA